MSGEVLVDNPDTTLTPELAAALRKLPPCQHCAGHHVRACPRVRRLEYHPSGSIAVVEFWRDGQWPTDHIIWPEELAAVDEPETS